MGSFFLALDLTLSKRLQEKDITETSSPTEPCSVSATKEIIDMFPELVVFIAADGHLCACARIVKILPVRRHSGVFSALPRVRHLFCHIFLRGMKEYAKFNTIPNSVDTHGVYWLV